MQDMRQTTIGQGASGQEALDAHEHMVEQRVDGVLYTMPRPSSPHSLACYRLGGELYEPFGRGHWGPGGWWILFEPDVQCGADLLVPDLAGWRRERMPELLEQPIELPPDWVCEILSPSTRRLDLGRKREIYARQSVQWLWFVDPEAHTLEAFALQDGAWRRIASLAGNEPVSVPPFEAISFPLEHLWARARRAARTIHEPTPPYVVERAAGSG